MPPSPAGPSPDLEAAHLVALARPVVSLLEDGDQPTYAALLREAAACGDAEQVIGMCHVKALGDVYVPGMEWGEWWGALGQLRNKATRWARRHGGKPERPDVPPR